MKKLPVLATVAAVFRLAVYHFGYAVKIAWPWLVVMTLLSQTYMPFDVAVLRGEEPGDLSGVQFVCMFLMALVSMAGWSSIAVLWHRHLLRHQTFSGVPVQLDSCTGNYLLRFIFISLVVAVPLILSRLAFPSLRETGIGTGYEINIIATLWDNLMKRPEMFAIAGPLLLAITIVSIRLSISLPAAALNEIQIRPGIAWAATRGNSLRLLAVTLLAGLPILLIYQFTSILESLIFSLPSPLDLWLLNVLWGGQDFITVMIGITLLSLAYTFFIENKPFDSTTLTT